jgi:hypothetical protein
MARNEELVSAWRRLCESLQCLGIDGASYCIWVVWLLVSEGLELWTNGQ